VKPVIRFTYVTDRSNPKIIVVTDSDEVVVHKGITVEVDGDTIRFEDFPNWLVSHPSAYRTDDSFRFYSNRPV
jgi:hypothetical protein